MEGDVDRRGGPPEPVQAGSEPTGDTTERLLAMRARWSGPLPPPEALEQFERASPGAADRILGMAEQEEAHRHRQERDMLQSESSARARGQWMAFTLALVIILGGIWLIYKGKQWEGLVAVLAPLATLIGLFLYAREHPPGDDQAP